MPLRRASCCSKVVQQTCAAKDQAPDFWGIKSLLASLQLFCDKERAQLKEANPEAKFGEVNALLAAKWKEVSDANKKVLQTMHEVRAPSS